MTRSIFIPAAFILLATPLIANAQTPQMQTPDMMSKLYACKTISDSAARLACYDRNIGVVETAQEAGELITIDKAGAHKIQKESFGFNIPSLPQLSFFTRKDKVAGKEKPAMTAQDELNTLSFKIKSARKQANGRVVFYLENGHVWEQSESARIPRINPKRENILKIKRASLNSFIGQVNGTGAGMRLKRVE